MRKMNSINRWLHFQKCRILASVSFISQHHYGHISLPLNSMCFIVQTLNDDYCYTQDKKPLQVSDSKMTVMNRDIFK